jgi:hypothetical protein
VSLTVVSKEGVCGRGREGLSLKDAGPEANPGARSASNSSGAGPKWPKGVDFRLNQAQ